jgi:hypothetical protein
MGRLVKRNLCLFHSFLGVGALSFMGASGRFEAHERLARGVRQPLVRIEYEGVFLIFLGLSAGRPTRLFGKFFWIAGGSAFFENNVCCP